MRSKLWTGLLAMMLAGCASRGAEPPTPILADAAVQVFTARDAGHGHGPIGISERFTLNGKMVAFVTFVWPEGHAAWGEQKFESRWYSGDRLISEREVSFQISRSPFNFFSNVLPVDLGPGPGRFELYANGRKIAEKSFEIVLPIALTTVN